MAACRLEAGRKTMMVHDRFLPTIQKINLMETLAESVDYG